MAKLQKFLFDLDFDAPPPKAVPDADLDEDLSFAEADEPPPPPPPPPPTFSEEDLMVARAQATEAGREAGRLEAETATERLLAASLQTIGEMLRDLQTQQAAANEDRMRDSVSVALAVVRKLQPEMSRENALDEIAAVIRECLTHIEDDVRVTVRVNAAHIEAIRQYGRQAAETTGFEGKLIYTADPRIEPGDCRVEWGDGGMERDQARLWTEIDATIARALGAEPAPEPQAAGEEDVLEN